MTAMIRTFLSMEFVENTPGTYDLADINTIVTSIEFAFNTIIEKFTEQGFYMEDMVLEKAVTMSGLMTAMNNNVNTINQYISSLNNALKTNYLLDKEVLSVMSVDIVNRDGAATVEIHPLKINIGLHNGQIVEINTTNITSTLGADVQTIVHA